MISRAAGYHVNLADALNLLIRKSHLGQIDHTVPDHRVQGVLQGLRLLVNLFHHEMLKTGLLSCFGIPFDLHRLFFDLVAVQVIEGDSSLLQPGQLQVADVIDVPGVFQDGRDVGGHEALAILHAQNHRAVLAGHVDLLRIIFKHHSQRIGTADTHHGMVDGIHRGTQVFLVIIVYQLDRHLGVGLGIELITFPQQLIFQLLIVLNDAVVYADHIAVVAAMGMGVVLGWLAVGRPAGVADAAVPCQGLAAIGLL